MSRIYTILCFSVVCTFLFIQTGYAQNVRTPKKCGFDIAFQKEIEKDPTYLERYNKLQKFVNDFVAQHPGDYDPKVNITIPVVFHVVLSAAQSTAFLDVQLSETLTMLNRDYGGTNPHSLQTFAVQPTMKANTTIQFCPAAVTPTGAATNGIERRSDYTGPKWASGDAGMKHSAQGGFDAWDVNKYLNIWVCDLADGLCGFGLMPIPPLTNEYGLVDDYEYTGRTNAVLPLNGGGTAAHEIGHCFNLDHPWANGNCSTDNCADTPPQNAATYGNHMPYNAATNPSGDLTQTGTGTPPVVTDNCTTTAPGIMYTNFMDYSDDTTYANFTPNQKTRMLACFASGGPLYQLSQSTACGPPPVAPVAAFTGSPLTIPQGNSVTFVDASTNTPTTWTWTFPGGTPSSFSGMTPPAITYNTPGDYSVTLVISNAAGIDTLIKNPYVHVLPLSSDLPDANFYATQTSVPVAGTTDFVDISTGTPVSWKWTFSGGTPSTSSQQNPTGIAYAAAGNYNVKLKAINYNGSDSLTKTAYIHVSSTYTNKPVIDFTASNRLIPMGTTVSFTDLSTNNPATWKWTFEGGSITTTNLQNPMVTYAAPGTYNVKLKATNPIGGDSLTKTDYIVVTPTYMPKVCDTIRNAQKTEQMYFWHISPTAGYIPGHNSDNVKAYADRYVDYEHNQITAFLVPIKISKASSSATKIRFKVWGGTSLPDESHVLGYKDVVLNTMQSGFYKYVQFNPPINITGIFFAGYEITYAAGDTFVVSMAVHRGTNGLNTMYIKKSNNAWVPVNSVYNLTTSLGITPAVCLVNDVDIIEEDNLLIFPNPSHDIFNIDVQEDNWSDVEIRVFDMLGKLVKANAENVSPHLFQVDMNNQPTGIYFLNIKKGNKVITKKISVVK